MLKKIRLFLRGIEADLPQAPDILFNYTEDDLRNPTIVKNSYTKTITLDDTPNNNKIFSGFWDNQFVVGTGFNPTKKMAFALYQNNDLIEEGYARLDSVTGGVNAKKYQITLFGGLGDFFYELTYDNDEGGKKTLADLHYMSGTTSDDEFDFTIDMYNVSDAWKAMTMTEEEAAAMVSNFRKWKYINFVPAYEGLPDDFDTDKALINFRGSDFITGVTSGSGDATSAYTSFAGYALAEMANEHTGNEMREFRSYLQRPCLNVRKTIEAICKPENNGGYTVELDSHFFNDNNPYWTDTWMTLGLLRSFTPTLSTGSTVVTQSGTTYGGTQKSLANRYYWQTTEYDISGEGFTQDNLYSIKLAFTLTWNNLHQLYAASQAPKSSGLEFCSIDEVYWQMSCMIAQLVAYSPDGDIIAGGDAINLTSYWSGGTIGTTSYPAGYPDPSWFYQTLPWGTEMTNSVGRWMPTTSGGKNCRWNQSLSLSIDNVPHNATVKLLIRKYANLNSNYGSDTMTNCFLCGQRNDTTAYTNNWYFSSSSSDLPITVSVTNYECEPSNPNTVRSGSHFKKNNILGSTCSPAEFLLSYGKMFGLYFSKDRYEKKIYIRDRDTYYTNEIVSATEIIDRAKMDVKPVFVGTKWLDFKANQSECANAEAYKELYGIDYGIQRVNTGYDFNADIADLFKDSVFKGGIPTLEKSESFSYYDDDRYKPWMLEGFNYNLYLSGNTGADTTGVTYGEQSTIGVLQGFRGSLLKYYDLYEGLQLHDEDNSPVDGANILVFYNGNLNIENAVSGFSYGLKYWITDDTAEMMVLNDNKPCWLWTLTSLNKAGSAIAILAGEYTTKGIPVYSRYKYTTNTMEGGVIRKSLDFGTPKQLFNPLNTITSGSSLYAQYWENFVKDLYSPDTRVITTKALLPSTFSEEDMRKWWWFDGALWRLNKVTELNLAKETMTSVEFVKVQDTDNYSPS